MRHRYLQAAIAAVILALLGVTVVGLGAGGPAPVDRSYELERQLRCPVCNSVSVAESMSETAQAMRESVQEQIAAGRSDEEILNFFRARYGNWVVLDPPVRGRTFAVWAIPIVVGVAGVAFVLLRTRSPWRQPVSELTDEERQQVADALRNPRTNTAEDDAW